MWCGQHAKYSQQAHKTHHTRNQTTTRPNFKHGTSNPAPIRSCGEAGLACGGEMAARWRTGRQMGDPARGPRPDGPPCKNENELAPPKRNDLIGVTRASFGPVRSEPHACTWRGVWIWGDMWGGGGSTRPQTHHFAATANLCSQYANRQRWSSFRVGRCRRSTVTYQNSTPGAVTGGGARVEPAGLHRPANAP